jgi:predicted phage-related endonuclease
MTKQEKVKELVEVTKRIDADQDRAKTLRDELKTELKTGEAIPESGYVIEKKVVKSTITDANVLVKNGFDVSKVTITVTRIDPTLVKTIGLAEGKAYFSETETVCVSKQK